MSISFQKQFRSTESDVAALDDCLNVDTGARALVYLRSRRTCVKESLYLLISKLMPTRALFFLPDKNYRTRTGHKVMGIPLRKVGYRSPREVCPRYFVD